ncbi:hypothetical protein M426DRAFT_13790 [Hypoxylon sp. CI-4A]|nr:hypothetical protein M426DRAFT_13790 [Hypoxylon sp. CI-4A]
MAPTRTKATAAKNTEATKKTARKPKATVEPTAASRQSRRVTKRSVTPEASGSSGSDSDSDSDSGRLRTSGGRKEADHGREIDRQDAIAEELGPAAAKAPRAVKAVGRPAAKATKATQATQATQATKATKATKAPKAAAKPAAKSAAKAAKPAASKAKRAREEEDEEEVEVQRPAKKARATKDEEPPKPASRVARKVKEEPVAAKPKPKPKTRGPGLRQTPINQIPSKQLDVFVFGEGSSGELGLGSKRVDGKKPIDVKRPRLNPNLKGVVALACGGMHCVALTHDQTVLTWGVNDDKALGRDTNWDGGVRDIDAEEDDEDEDDTGVNPHESTPGRVDLSILSEGTQISQVAATDSASFILTDDGWVYGWGTFRGSDGIIGFSEEERIQSTPTIIPGLKNITKLATGSNHVLALDNTGKVFTWGSGGQYQLGRKPLSRLGGPGAGLTPQPCGRFTKKHQAVDIAAGSYHSFYLDNDGRVWSWGLNNYSQTGLDINSGQDDAMVLQPRVVTSLEEEKIAQVVGGEHHSVACTAEGKLLTWGRVDGHQVGQPSDIHNEENTIYDDNNKPRILQIPTATTDIAAAFIAAGTDTSFAIDTQGKVYSWGFSANYQTGQGTTDDIEVPTLINNSAIRGKRIVWAGAGGQYSVIAADLPSEENEEAADGQ